MCFIRFITFLGVCTILFFFVVLSLVSSVLSREIGWDKIRVSSKWPVLYHNVNSVGESCLVYRQEGSTRVPMVSRLFLFAFGRILFCECIFCVFMIYVFFLYYFVSCCEFGGDDRQCVSTGMNTFFIICGDYQFWSSTFYRCRTVCILNCIYCCCLWYDDDCVAVGDTVSNTDRPVPQELPVDVRWIWSSGSHHEVVSSVPFVTDTVSCKNVACSSFHNSLCYLWQV